MKEIQNDCVLSEQEIQDLWDKFYPRMKTAVRARVAAIDRAVASPSEVALSAFNSFVGRVQDGKFPELDADDTWPLLRQFAIWKANDHRKRFRAQKAGGDVNIHGQSLANDGQAAAIDMAASDGPTPSEDVETREVLDEWLQLLPDDSHRNVILMKLGGATTADIVDAMQLTQRTVQKRVQKAYALFRSASQA